MAELNKFKTKKAEAEILDELYMRVEEKLADTYTEYRPTDEQEQDKDWRTGELLWEDEEQTIPKMKPVWKYMEIPEEELNEDKQAIVKACKTIMTALEKML
jgi:hypothetical protein